MSTLRAFKLSGIVRDTGDCLYPTAAAPKSTSKNAKVMGTLDENSRPVKPFFPAAPLTADDCVHPNTLGSSKVTVAAPSFKRRSF